MKEKIFDLIARSLDISVITDETSPDNVETWDSIRHVMLLTEIETEFNCIFTPEEIAEMTNAGNIANIVINKTK